MITLTLEGQNLSISTPHIVAKTVDYLTVKIERIGAEWKKLHLHIFFKLESTVYELLTDGDYIGTDSHLNLSEGKWEVSVTGYEFIDGSVIKKITTNTIGLNVATPPPDAGESLPYTPPSAIEQIQAIAQSVRDDADAGLFTGPQVVSAVDAWLDEHPEATTTVEDGSIAEEKLSSELRSKLIKDSANLIGNTINEYYPVFVQKGMPVTISTSDGSAFPSNGKLYYYEQDFTQIDWISITSGFGNKRTKVLSTTKDTYYLVISGSFTVPLMINYGETALPYTEYRWPFDRSVSWKGFAPSNIDTVLDAGIYRIAANRQYETIPQYAEGSDCTLVVYFPALTNTSNIQVLYARKNNALRVFCRSTNASTATDWKGICDDESTLSTSNQNITDSTAQSICQSDFDNLPLKKMFGVVPGSNPIAHAPTALGGFVYSLSQHDSDAYAAGNVQVYFDTNGRIHNRIRWDGGFKAWESPAYNDKDLLRKMKVVALGDSICRGGRNSDKGFIGDVGCQWVNIGVGGASLSTKVDSSATHDTQHFMGAANIPDELIKYATKTSESWYMTPDAIVAEGGINDYVFNAPLGTPSSTPANTDLLASALDKTTVCGGLEYLCYQMIKLYPNARHLFLITHQSNTAPWTANSQGYTQTQMVEKIIAICKMYGVGIVNVFENLSSYFSQNCSPTRYADDSSVTDLYLIDKDKIHPLALGYKTVYAPLVRKELI